MADYYSLIAKAVSGLENNTRDFRRALYDLARTAQTTQLKNMDPPLSETEISLECLALEGAIRKVEAEATANTTTPVTNDAKIVLDYANFMTETTTRVDCFYDVKSLPYPKEMIVAAIEREIVRSPLEAHVDWLRTGASLLWNFLEGVGLDPRPSAGGSNQLDLSQLPESERQVDDGDSAGIMTHPEYNQESDESSKLTDIAIKEQKQIDERIAAAVRSWKALRNKE
jgi:hypothetical protein